MLYFRFTAPRMECATAFHVSDDLGRRDRSPIGQQFAATGGCARRPMQDDRARKVSSQGREPPPSFLV
jgi:hypothetical protein